MSDRQLIADLLSALEYHTEQTRPIQFSKVAIEAAQEYLRKPPPPKREWQGLTDDDEIPWDGVDAKSFARAIEAKLKQKNHDQR